MFKKLFEKPFKLISIIGIIYLLISITVNLFTGFSYKNSIYPFSKIITLATQSLSLVLFILSFIFYTKTFIYYIGLEILIFSNLYNSNIYVALFLSSILLVFLIIEQIKPSIKNILIYIFIEILKISLIIPYGTNEFFFYTGLNLFALFTIGCINLLFKHAYSKNENTSINIDNFNFSERQKDCIKEIVLNNTTIKALAINHKVSESAIKKDLTHIYNVLGITGKADLKALFIGYKF